MLITLATGNLYKLQELEACSEGTGVRFVVPEVIPEVEESGKTFEENALIKAQSVQPLPGSVWVAGEDTGLVVDALAGLYGLNPFPGIQTNRWLTPERYEEITGKVLDGEMTQVHRNAALLALMKGERNHRGRYVCAMALCSASRIVTATGTLEVEIMESARGLNGFGYDPVTSPMGSGKTMAELSLDEKNMISHRGKAFRSALAQLEG